MDLGRNLDLVLLSKKGEKKGEGKEGGRKVQGRKKGGGERMDGKEWEGEKRKERRGRMVMRNNKPRGDGR